MMAVDSPQEETELDEAEENNGPDVNAGMYLRIPQHVFFFGLVLLLFFVLFCFVFFFVFFLLLLFFIVLSLSSSGFL